MSSKTIALGVAALLIVTIGGIGAYSQMSHTLHKEPAIKRQAVNEPVAPSQTSSPSEPEEQPAQTGEVGSAPKTDISGWNTYRNASFRVKYPPFWNVVGEFRRTQSIKISNKNHVARFSRELLPGQVIVSLMPESKDSFFRRHREDEILPGKQGKYRVVKKEPGSSTSQDIVIISVFVPNSHSNGKYGTWAKIMSSEEDLKDTQYRNLFDEIIKSIKQ